jgi:serine/threonine protein kinase
VYSLGCVLFETLTGTVPYPLDNEFAKLYAHDSQPPPSVCERAPDVPNAFDAVLARAMAKTPEQRYLSAGDLGRAALAAASDTSLSRAETSVATGAAAPQEATAVPTQGIPTQAAGDATVPQSAVTAPAAQAVPTAPAAPPPAASAPPAAPPPTPPDPTPARRRRRPILAGSLALGALAAAGLVIALTSGSSPKTSSAPSGSTPNSSSPSSSVPSTCVLVRTSACVAYRNALDAELAKYNAALGSWQNVDVGNFTAISSATAAFEQAASMFANHLAALTPPSDATAKQAALLRTLHTQIADLKTLKAAADRHDQKAVLATHLAAYKLALAAGPDLAGAVAE